MIFANKFSKKKSFYFCSKRFLIPPDENFFKNGQLFDGSSIAGWKKIHESDMIMMPQDDTATIDPFTKESTCG